MSSPIDAPAPGGSDKRIALTIAAGAIVFRLVSAILAFFATLAFPLAGREATTMFGQPSPFWDPFTRFDAGWYYQIARNGYLFVPGGAAVGVGKVGKIAYFPAYPLLMRYVGRLFGPSQGAVYLGGILVSWTAFVLAMVVLFYLARLDLPRDRAARAVLLAAIFPFSFFYGLVYTEALFLLCTVASIYAFRQGRWVLGGVAGGVATATRVNGILMLPALAWIAWRGTQVRPRERLAAVAGLALACGGIAAYSFYVYRLSGNPFEWARSITQWGYHPGGPPWSAPVELLVRLFTHPYAYLAGSPMALYETLYGVTGLAFVIATAFVWRQFGTAYGLFMLANLLLPLSSGVFEGVGRYCSVLFPCFLWLGSIRSQSVSTALSVGFALFYTLGLALFATLHPLF